MKKRLILAATLLSTFAATSATAAAQAAQPLRWQVQATAKPTHSVGSSLSSVSCPTSDWCMSVGSASPSTDNWYPIAEVRSGAHWALVQVPKPSGATYTSLSSVSCLTTQNCFAVGVFSTSGPNYRPLIAHWNGSRWSLMSANLPAGQVVGLDHVTCTSARTCFAVGYQDEPIPGGGPLLNSLFAESWNGKRWAPTPIDASPQGADRVGFASMSCPSANSCFAVGNAISDGNFRPVAEHYANGRWTQITLPLPAGKDIGSWSAVSCPTATFCLAVGQLGIPGYSDGLMAAGWNGQRWVRKTPPPAVGGKNSFSALSCRSAVDCVGVGDTLAQNSQSPPYSQRLSGGTWTKLVVPQPKGAEGATLASVSCRTAGPCVAVGDFSTPVTFGTVLGEILR